MPDNFDLDMRSELRRTGDKHGNAPKHCPSQQYLPTSYGPLYQCGTAARIRRIYLRAGLHWCAKCGGWHS